MSRVDPFFKKVEFPRTGLKKTKTEPHLEWSMNPRFCKGSNLKRSDILKEGEGGDDAKLEYFKAILDQSASSTTDVQDQTPHQAGREWHGWNKYLTFIIAVVLVALYTSYFLMLF